MSELRLIAQSLRFAEAPRWRGDRLWFSDVHDYRLKTVTLDGIVAVAATVPSRPSGLGFLPDGRLLMATALDCKLWTVTAAGVVTEIANLSPLTQGVLNDMVVDGLGRAFVGDTGFKMGTQAPRPGRIIYWKEGEEARIVAEDLVFPNGCVVTPDTSRFLIAETMAKRISAFTISNDGCLADRTVFATLESPPDGLCMDVEGAVWAGLPHEGAFVRINADGTIVRRVQSAAPFAVTCALGGAARRTLFLCSAYTDLERLGKGETTARIDALEVEAAGAGWP